MITQNCIEAAPIIDELVQQYQLQAMLEDYIDTIENIYIGESYKVKSLSNGVWSSQSNQSNLQQS